MTKQVIIVRTDLKNDKGQKVRSSKLMAQVAHGSVKCVLQAIEAGNMDIINEWNETGHTKIILKCSSEAELNTLYYMALGQELNTSLVVDEGRTEFGGVETNTCVCIGPHKSEDIDPITKGLSLL